MSRTSRRGERSAPPPAPKAEATAARATGDLLERIRADIGDLSKVFGQIANCLVADPDSSMHAPLRAISAGAGVSGPCVDARTGQRAATRRRERR